MPRYPDFKTPEGIARRLAEGRGTGSGPSYRPYFTRFDVRSHGERRETYSAKCRRGIHLLSRLEFHLYLMAEHDPEIIDIREQYPLPLEETEEIAEQLGIQHPRNWRTRCNVVMTTDLMLTRRTASREIHTEAWSGKYADSLRHWRTAEKQRLEEEWHTRKGYRWEIRTEKSVPPRYVSNLAWLHPLQRPDAVLAYDPSLPDQVDEVMRKLMRNTTDVLWRVAAQCDSFLGFGANAISLYVCRFLLATNRWRTDLHNWDRARQPLILQ